MKSIIKYLIYFLAVVLIIWWLVSAFKGKQTNDISQENTELPGDNSVGEGEDEISLDEILEDTGESEESEGQEPDKKEEEPATTTAGGFDDSDDILIDEEPEPAKKTAAPRQTKASTGNSHGRYLVITGSFIVPGNAKRLEQKLERLGYSNAEVVNFDLSEYHSVIAGRYSGLSEARRVANALKSKGIDAYVQRKKQ